MPILSSNLILASTLFLSPSHPALVKQHSNNVWFSEPNSIEVQALPQGLLLKSLKTRARLQAHGLQKQKSWTTIQTLSDANYKALERCSSLTFSWNSTHKVPQFVAHPSDDLFKQLQHLSHCGFDELEMAPQSPHFETYQKLMSQIESEAEWKGLRILNKEWLGGRKLITLANGPSSSRLKSLLGPFSAFVEIQTREAPKPGNTLIFEVTLFEFSRHAAHKLGIKWPDHIRFMSLEGNIFKNASSALELGFDFGESQGVGRVLAKPQIRVKAGQVSKFHSGGEIPITLMSENIKKTEWKSYGLILEIGVPKETPTGASEITVDFKVELSEPNIVMGGESSPGMSVRKLESQFDLRIRESTVLSTMIQTQSGAHRSGLIGLSRLPVAKNLFSNKSEQNHESELWFAIRPVWDEISWPQNLEQKGEDDIRNL